LEENEERWLVASYREVAWLKNARAARQASLGRGRKSETVGVVELSPDEAASVLKQYLSRLPVVRRFFDVTPKSQIAEFVAEAPRHPVFRIR
jgi:hypothetical protein